MKRFAAACFALALILSAPGSLGAEFCQSYAVSVTTDASGDATAYTTAAVNGRILAVIYTADGTAPYAATVDFVITGATSGQIVWDEDNLTASKTVAPRQATHSTAGVAALYAAGGAAVNDYVWIATERIKIVIAGGGNAKVGAFTIIVG